MKIRKLTTAAAMGSFTATVALLAGLSSANAQGAPGGGSFPGSILIPGTNTSFKVGGYVKMDFMYDFSAQANFANTAGIALNPNGIPLDWGGVLSKNESAGHTIHGTSQMTASESRFNIETRTPTSYGELKTLIEGDFVNPSLGDVNSNNVSLGASPAVLPGSTFKVESNSTAFRLRLAYGTLGPWLAGQYPSVFRDTAAESEQLDFGGPMTVGTLRVPQFRYTFDFGNGLLLAVAAENPQTSWIDSSGATFGTAGALFTNWAMFQGDKIPDFTAALTYTQPWGHVGLGAVIRDLYVHAGGFGSTGGPAPASGAVACGRTPGNPLGVSTSTTGWGLRLGANYNTWGKDNLVGQFGGGQGDGRYQNAFGFIPDAILNCSNNHLTAVGSWGGMISYQHWWTDTLRTNVNGSFNKQVNNTGDFSTSTVYDGQAEQWYTVHVNLIWSPVPQMDTGIEYIHSNKKLQSSQQGDFNRLQISSKFKF